ncbi:MAG: ATP-binding cassette domain-containing protein, partial [Muribaculaceae bacterium]|nr:ATP-binding cassette domain-containing protein [Muribaculaceae bacterium]
MDPILQIHNLRKFFGEKRALNDVSFDVDRGSITGLLGPNGAGKTTLLRIINGIMVSDSGEALINGRPASLETTNLIGYMPEERGLYDKMTVEDQIMYFGLLKGGDKKRLREVMKEYLELFNIYDDRRRKVKELSKGNQQKVQIISTLVHEPELVILDEPFSGFDPINGQLLQELIARLHDRGTTIMLSSHNMPAIEEMCSDIALIDHGNLLVKDSIENIKEANKDDSLLLTTSSPLVTEQLIESGTVTEITPTRPVNWRKGYAYSVRKAEGKSNMDLLDAVAFQSDILHFEEKLPTLTDIFIKYTSRHPDTPAETAENARQVQ